jgi:hypothetical protein
MKGDFSRDTFDLTKRFRRVLMQQGRVQLDADFNEQVGILLRYMQALAVDLRGPHWGTGFALEPRKEDDTTLANDFAIGAGHYYVDGLLCESDGAVYTDQVDYPLTEAEKMVPNTYLAYLDVWERHITPIEDKRRDAGNIPGIREVALGGADTSTRSRVVWQVKLVPIGAKDSNAADLKKMSSEDFRQLLRKLGAEVRPGIGRLRARTDPGGPPFNDDPCVMPPQSRYRGFENQLYRVEVHRAEVVVPEPPPAGRSRKRAAAAQQVVNAPAMQATFKWSRENGSVVFPIRDIDDTSVTLDQLWQDTNVGLVQGDWVELENDTSVLRGERGQLCQVLEIDLERQLITLDREVTISDDPILHPVLRRWDQKQHMYQRDDAAEWNDGTIVVTESNDDERGWITLENGIQVQFQPGFYRSGDYWLIPARTVIGDIEWPRDGDKSLDVAPHGVEHHYAPLWIVGVDADGKITIVKENDCRNT